jgi:hypothetical protein
MAGCGFLSEKKRSTHQRRFNMVAVLVSVHPLFRNKMSGWIIVPQPHTNVSVCVVYIGFICCDLHDFLNENLSVIPVLSENKTCLVVELNRVILLPTIPSIFKLLSLLILCAMSYLKY